MPDDDLIDEPLLDGPVADLEAFEAAVDALEAVAAVEESFRPPREGPPPWEAYGIVALEDVPDDDGNCAGCGVARMQRRYGPDGRRYCVACDPDPYRGPGV